MIRECSLTDISDGKTYELIDMVKAECDSCEGCHACCAGMGQSIVLDPFDIHLLKQRLRMNLNELLQAGYIELNMVDGLILPNLRMNEKDRCSFLDENMRCGIYEARPGICRIFPLGRIYAESNFKYFLQSNECKKTNRSKVKVRKWIDTERLADNQEFILSWHTLIRKAGERNIRLRDSGQGELVNETAMYILNTFYVNDIKQDDVYSDLKQLIAEALKSLKL